MLHFYEYVIKNTHWQIIRDPLARKSSQLKKNLETNFCSSWTIFKFWTNSNFCVANSFSGSTNKSIVINLIFYLKPVQSIFEKCLLIFVDIIFVFRLLFLSIYVSGIDLIMKKVECQIFVAFVFEKIKTTTVVCILVRTQPFPTFWRNRP